MRLCNNAIGTFSSYITRVMNTLHTSSMQTSKIPAKKNKKSHKKDLPHSFSTMKHAWFLLFLICLHRSRADYECKTVTTQENFDLAQFVKKRWYVHQQAVTKYVPVERNYCSHADYEIRDKKTFPWGYTVNVHNYAEDATGKEYGGPLCAAQDEKSGDPAKLKVAPCFLPQRLTGPYWVVAYDEAKGYALVSGGQPKIKTRDGLCRNEQDSIKEAGLWIFLRSRQRDQELIDEVRDIATGKGFDVGVLNDVHQTNCGVKEKAKSEL